MDWLAQQGARIARDFDRLLNACAFISGLIILYMMISISVNVALRKLFSHDIGWVLEFSQYGLLYMTFLVSGWVLRQRGHVRLTIFLDRLSPLWSHAFDMVTCVSGAAASALLGWETAFATLNAFQHGNVFVEVFPVKEYIIWLIMPIGFALLMLQFLRIAYQDFRAVREHRKIGGPGISSYW